MNENLLPEFKGDDVMDVAPEQALSDAIRDLRKGYKADKAYIILLNTEDTCYQTRGYNSGLLTSEAIALLDIQKSHLLAMLAAAPESDSSEDWKNQ